MELKLLHLYHDIMNLYGDWANIAVLKRHLEDLGNTVSVDRVSFGGGADIAGADFLFLGAGTERSQKAVLTDFRQYGPAVIKAARDGKPMLFTGTSFELLGKEIRDGKGNVHQGIGLADFSVEETARRITGDVFGECSFAREEFVGFMNKCSLIHGISSPLILRCAMGFGNEAESGPEGYHENNVFATHLTGPALVKNPHLTRAVISCIYSRRGETLPAKQPEYPWEQQGYEVTISELRGRAGSR